MRYDVRAVVTVDGVAKSGLSVFVSIRRDSDNYYWNGSSWQGSEYKLQMVDNGDGSYTYPFDDSCDDTQSPHYFAYYTCDDSGFEFSAGETFVKPSGIVKEPIVVLKKPSPSLTVVKKNDELRVVVSKEVVS